VDALSGADRLVGHEGETTHQYKSRAQFAQTGDDLFQSSVGGLIEMPDLWPASKDLPEFHTKADVQFPAPYFQTTRFHADA